MILADIPKGWRLWAVGGNAPKETYTVRLGKGPLDKNSYPEITVNGDEYKDFEKAWLSAVTKANCYDNLMQAQPKEPNFPHWEFDKEPFNDTLYGADPSCIHKVYGKSLFSGGGIACRKCSGWYCA